MLPTSTQGCLAGLDTNFILDSTETRDILRLPLGNTPMPYWLLIYDVVDQYVERRAPFRAEHLALAQAATQKGQLILGGALADPPDQAYLLFKGEREVAQQFVDNDPYVREGLVVRWSIRPWTIVAGAALPMIHDIPLE